MNRVHCSACKQSVIPEPPNHSYWVLIVTFWVFSLLFGIGAAVSGGWGFLLLVAWVLLATSTGVLVQHATSWCCPECGASVVPPAEGLVPAHSPARAFG